MTSNEVALLSQQLQGIMECWDMNNLFYLLKMPQLYKYHKHRLAKLVNIHQYTNCIMVKRYNEIGEIPYAYESQLKLPIDSNMERSSKRNLINTVLDSWVKWIDSIKELYIQPDAKINYTRYVENTKKFLQAFLMGDENNV